MEPFPVIKLMVYKKEFNSPPTPPFSASTLFPATGWNYQLKVACPFCLRAGYSRMNFIKLEIMKAFPLCWSEDCFDCGNTFYTNNGLPFVCLPCRNQVECLEKGVVTVELLEDFKLDPPVKVIKKV